MATTKTEAFKLALHYARLIPLGKDDKRRAVHRWAQQVKLMLKN